VIIRYTRHLCWKSLFNLSAKWSGLTNDGSPFLWATFGYCRPVAKPLALQLAGGAKLWRIRHRKRSKRPTEVGFGATSYESTNYRKLAEDGENEHDQSNMPNSEHFDWKTRVLNVPISCIRSVSAGYRERSGTALRRCFAITSK
jgi:hypothetical protein